MTEAAQLAELVIARCRKLASFSEDLGGIRRTFLSPPMREVHHEITSWLDPLGVKVHIDAVGNLRGFYAAHESPSPRLIVGSHLDTVPNAGAFDGILGVVIAVALLEALAGERLPYAIEIVGFSEEEGVRFGVPFIGSRALVGRIDENLLDTRDCNGATIRAAIANLRLEPEEIVRAAIADDVCGYLEFHIEQGPVLDSLGLPLGVVEAIAGQSRLEFVFTGRANHAGTTPMNLRLDAMAAAAEWISDVERFASANDGLVATVGSLQVSPGTVNVIAGQVRASLDVRHKQDEIRLRALKHLIHTADEIARRRNLTVRSTLKLNQPAVSMDQSLTEQITVAIRATRCEPHRMVSGAGHDAMILAEKVPAAMVFLRTPGGVSHDPSETVAVEDVAKAIECGVHLLHQLSSSPKFQTRTCRA